MILDIGNHYKNYNSTQILIISDRLPPQLIKCMNFPHRTTHRRRVNFILTAMITTLENKKHAIKLYSNQLSLSITRNNPLNTNVTCCSREHFHVHSK